MSAIAQRVTHRPALYETVVIVTRETQLEGLVRRFNTVDQARFYLEHAGQEFDPVQAAHARYHKALDTVRHALPRTVRHQIVDRAMLPQMVFRETDLIITVGQDGLVANTAKFVNGQPIIAVNPDPLLFDGVLMPFTADMFRPALDQTLRDSVELRHVTMAKATLHDGQTLLGFNDLFVGALSHVSARYRIEHDGATETHSSSGIIVSTGAGSTGWLQSVYAGAAGIVEALGGQVAMPADHGRIPWNADYLVYSVREPFPSNTTQTGLVFGIIRPESPLRLDSQMNDSGVVFSDGVEADRLEFNAGAVATIGVAEQKATLVFH